MEVVILPGGHTITRFSRPHCEQVGHHCTKSWSKAGLSDETQLELSKTDHIIPLLPVPRGDVEKVGFVVVLHQLDDDARLLTVVLQTDDPHNISSIFSIRIR